MGERLPRILAGLAVLVGVGVALLGASVFVDAWLASRAWAGTAEARLAEVPGEAPIWLDEPQGSVPSPTLEEAPPPYHGAPRSSRPPAPEESPRPAPLLTAAERGDPQGAGSPPTPQRGGEQIEPEPIRSGEAPLSPVPAPSEIELAEVDFRFLAPPEPGAHARLAVTLQNRASVPTGPISVTLPARWFQSFEILGAIPAVLDDRESDGQPSEQERHFVFEGVAPGERQTFELHVISTGEEIDAPEVRLVLSPGVELSEGEPSAAAEVGRVKPRTVAPRPRPGPARAVSIPSLGVKAAVVPVPWEPPPFVVGQVAGSAAVSLGNTVLLGHLAGPQGDVFARLDRLRPGDEVIAVSRGLEYRFIVSEIAVLPYDDVQPTEPTETPRLTLMTCTGEWSVLRQDYSHRLWVVAEPPERAEQTIRANAERAVQAAREAEEAAAARAAHEAEIDLTPQPPLRAGEGATGNERGEVIPVGRGDEVTPVTAASPTTEARASGLTIDAPADGEAVRRRVVVRGRRAPEADPAMPFWLVVRADVPGSRWYALDQPLELENGGTWQAEIELGGAAGIRHEIRVGTVDANTDALLRRHAAERRGQPLDDLPRGFTTGAQVVVERR